VFYARNARATCVGTGVVTGSRDPLGVQQYICCYFNLELDKVTEQSPTVPQLCAFRLIVRVSLK